MRKKLLCLAAALVLVPFMAWAGMTAVSDVELEEIDGQTGISIDATMSTTATMMSWEDDDGFSGATSTGAVILSGMTLPNISLSNVVIDVGTTAGTSYLAIATGNSNIISGDMTIQDIVIGSNDGATTESLGLFQVQGIGMGFGTIKISGHGAP